VPWKWTPPGEAAIPRRLRAWQGTERTVEPMTRDTILLGRAARPLGEDPDRPRAVTVGQTFAAKGIRLFDTADC